MAFRARMFTLLDMIKFEHTVFALPFAYMGMIIGAGDLPSLSTFLLVTLAMVGARTYAMALNRLLDRHLDKKNPRTRDRALPKGSVSASEAWAMCGCALGLFFIAVFLLPSLCRILWPLVIIPMTFYSLLKRVTWTSHIFLGLCLGMAPLGAWVATTNTLPTPGIWLLGAGVLLWTAGFDIIYSCQDYAFDRKEGLHSVPARFGIAKALIASKTAHCGATILFILTGFACSLGAVYYIGVAAVAVFLWYENSIISPRDLSRVTVSFFTVNGFVSIFAFVFTFIAVCFPP